MNEDRTSLRKQSNILKANLKDHIIANDEFKLTLRKNKLFASLMEKRLNGNLIKSSPITFNDIILESKLENQIKMLKEYLYERQSPDLDEEKSEYIADILFPQFSFCLFNDNTSILTKENILLICIDLFDSFISLFINVLFLTQLEEQISLPLNLMSHKTYNTLLLILLSNLLNESEESHKIITNTINIPKIIQSKYASANEFSTTDDAVNNIKMILFNLITNFLVFHDNENKRRLLSIAKEIIIPEIINSYTSMNSAIFFQAIKALNTFAYCHAMLPLVVNNKDLLSILNTVITTKTNQSTVIEIFCDMVSETEEGIDDVLNEGLVKCLITNVASYCLKIKDSGYSKEEKSSLYIEEGHTLIYSIRAISNIICNERNKVYTALLLNKEASIIELLLECFKSFNNANIQNEVINMFIKGLDCSSEILKNAFINTYSIHEVFYQILIGMCFENHNSNESSINRILNLLDAILVFASQTSHYLNIKIKLQQLDFVDNLTKIQLRFDNELISKKIEDLLSIHWNENEIYYNVCNDYMNVR